MPNVNIDDKLYQEIREYCRLNKLTISVFVNDLLKKTFLVEKYDDAPPFFKKKKEPEIEPIQVDIIRKMVEENTPQEFEQEYLAEPEPIKKEKYEKPEVISVEEKPKELTPKEKARQRIHYL